MTVGRISSMVVVANNTIIVFSICWTYPLYKPRFYIQQNCSRRM